MSLIKIIREAIINNPVRNYAFMEIQEATGCSRHTSKALYFAFLWYASEEYLKEILDNE